MIVSLITGAIFAFLLYLALYYVDMFRNGVLNKRIKSPIKYSHYELFNSKTIHESQELQLKNRNLADSSMEMPARKGHIVDPDDNIING